jgi:hypothetical protein
MPARNFDDWMKGNFTHEEITDMQKRQIDEVFMSFDRPQMQAIKNILNRTKPRTDAENDIYSMFFADEDDTKEDDLSEAIEDSEEGYLTIKAKKLSGTYDKEPHIQVEYDLDYWGGEYSGCGDFAYIPSSIYQGRTLNEAFELVTGFSPEHIIHYSSDEDYTYDGKLFEDEKFEGELPGDFCPNHNDNFQFCECLPERRG